MGYRSEVVLVLPQEVLGDEAALSAAAQSLLEEGRVKVKKSRNGKTYHWFHWESIKWYSGMDPVIDEIENLATELDPSDWGLVEVGEEFGDLKVHGIPYEFGVYPTQGVVIEDD